MQSVPGASGGLRLSELAFIGGGGSFFFKGAVELTVEVSLFLFFLFRGFFFSFFSYLIDQLN